MIKVSTGTARGRKLCVPKGLFVRPTSSQVREAFFDIIGDKVVNSRFLDLYAGTGAIGIEAISRGALRVAFVEKSSRCVKCIRENLELCGFSRFGEIIQADTLDIIHSLANRQHKFGIVYIDPPYAKHAAFNVLTEMAANKDICTKDVIVGIEHAKKTKLADNVPPFTRKSEYTYGDTVLSLYVMV